LVETGLVETGRPSATFSEAGRMAGEDSALSIGCEFAACEFAACEFAACEFAACEFAANEFDTVTLMVLVRIDMIRFSNGGAEVAVLI
jgi:hypothetical protein